MATEHGTMARSAAVAGAVCPKEAATAAVSTSMAPFLFQAGGREKKAEAEAAEAAAAAAAAKVMAATANTQSTSKAPATWRN